MLSPPAPSPIPIAMPALNWLVAPSLQPPSGAAVGVLMDHCADHEIFGEGEPADLLYRIVRGAARTFTVLTDGRRQIEAFHFPGDVLGLEIEAHYRVSAEAISDTAVLAIKRSVIDAACHGNSEATRQIWGLTCTSLARARSQLALLGRKTAVERVATFLLDMSSRNNDALKLQLPMSRSDIADYLGLTIETVSRSFSQLERDGLIARSSTKGFRDQAS